MKAIEPLRSAIRQMIGGAAPLNMIFLSRRAIRRAIRPDLHERVVNFNSFLMGALMDGRADEDLRQRYFSRPDRMRSVDLYNHTQPEAFMSLPEWKRLEWWNDELELLSREDLLYDGERPRAVRVIDMLFELTMAPLNRCPSRETRKFIERILHLPEVREYRELRYEALRPGRRS
ncbi:MAG: hypothetical protein ABI824_07845 [Acidobacteriota bacterium]